MEEQKKKKTGRPHTAPVYAATISDEEILYYKKAIDCAIWRYVLNSFRQYQMKDKDTSIGNTGWTIEDLRQHLFLSCFEALRKFNPASKTNKKSFVIIHMYRRCQQWCGKWCKPGKGYGAEVQYFSMFEENQ